MGVKTASLWSAAVGLVLLGSPALAKRTPAKPVPTKPANRPANATGGAANESVDWVRGLVIVTDSRIADLQAPSATVARIRAERLARDRIHERLSDVVKKLKVANGKTVGEMIGKDPTRWNDLISNAITINVEYGTDGSATVTSALSLEAVRSALFGPSTVPVTLEQGPTTLLIDARGLIKMPVVGLAVTGGSHRYQGPSLFVDSPEVAPLPVGPRVVNLKANKVVGDALVVAEEAEVQAASQAGALLVFLIGGQ